MTAPRAREHAGPPAPPDRRPPRRGGGSSPSPSTYASVAGRAAGPARLYGARRGLARSARALAAAALLALSGALALPAAAQVDVLVSNIGQTVSAGTVFDDDFALGQAFSVGADGGDYTLTSIEIPIGSIPITATDIGLLSVSVWSANSSGHPSSSLHTLMKPESIAAGTTAMFDAQAGAALEAGKTYVVVVYYNKDLPLQPPSWVFTGTGEDADPATGWVIADSRLFRTHPGTAWADAGAGAFKIRVNGTAVRDTPTPTNFTAAPDDSGKVTLSWDTPPTGVTGHEYRYKMGTGAYPADFTPIANSGVGGANQASFTVGSLTNEVVHRFQLRAVDADGESSWAESDAVTPTPGICDRTQQVRDTIVAAVSGADACNEVTVADLAGVTTLFISTPLVLDITSLKSGDFSGLTELTSLTVNAQRGLTALPSDVFSGLTKLETFDLRNNKLASLPPAVFSGLVELDDLALNGNALTSLPAELFSGLTALTKLRLNHNVLTSLPADVFSGLTSLELLHLSNNDLTSLPDGVFTGLTGLTEFTLGNNPDTGDTLALTVTVEKVGTDQVRAKVLAGAPGAVAFTPTLANGSLPASDTTLAVAAGAVDGTAETVTRTSGTMAAVTVDIDLTTQPSLPTNHSGYEFAKATGSTPAEILPDTRGPQNFTAKPGDREAVLAWDAPASGSGVTKHQYRQKAGTGSYGGWTDIPNSAEGEANEDGFTVENLTNETTYTFEVKRFVGTTGVATAESNTVTPTPGICDRTQQVQDGILAKFSDVDECSAVTVANLATVTSLDLDSQGITSLEAGDFAGLTRLTSLNLGDNQVGALPANLFTGLTSLQDLHLYEAAVTSLPADAFSGLTALTQITLGGNPSIGSLPADQFSELTNLESLDLSRLGMTTLRAGLFSGLSKLSGLSLSGNGLSALPAGVFSGLTELRTLILGDNPNAGDTLPLTVTVEKVGDDRVRAKVLAGAPFAVDFTATVVNGTLDGNATSIEVAAGSVEGTAVTVTRTSGTTGAVTVAIDLTTQPDLPTDHLGYEFARSSDLPVEVLPEEASLAPPMNLAATPGDRQAVLTWTPPAASSGYTRHEYRYKVGNGSFTAWTAIPDSGPNGDNGRGYTVMELANGTEHTFELRARDAGAGKSEAVTVTVEPTGPPQIEGVEVTSGPGLDGDTYGAGEEIRIEVTFDQPVQVTGDPELALDVGGESRLAEYVSGDGEEVVVFVYVVREDDRDGDGIEVGGDALRLDGNDGISNGAGDRAELAHEAPGAQPDHKVDGSQRVGTHTHAAFTHGHGHFNDGKGYYTETWPLHDHDGHEHPDEANGHPKRLAGHKHHADENPNASVFHGPDERPHGGVEHIHRCFSLKPSCNQGDDYRRRGDELGLPIEVTHRHEADSEPGHGFDWEAWFAGRGPDATGATVSAADAEAVGGADAHLRFEVTLEPAQAFAVRVDYATADGTATAGEDYRETRGVLEIPPGETRATVRVPVRDRAAADGEETMRLTLGSATAATVADGAATGTIRAPEPTTPPEVEGIEVVSTPRLSSDGNRKDTYGEGETIRIEVVFDQPVHVEGEPAMELEVGDPCLAVCEARYESGSGTDTLVFAYLVLDGDIDRNGVAIPANPIGESIDDLDGFRIRNEAGQEADLSYKRKGTQSGHRVNGHRQAGQHLSVADAEAHEADGEMAFTVRVEPRGLGLVTVDYETRDGTGNKRAVAGEDYTETRGTLRFNPLERERTVTVPIIDDLVPDDGETFTLRLSNADGAELRSGDREATGTIRNSDPAALSAAFPASAFASASHGGADDRPQVVVAFSEAVAAFAADTPSVSVTGGTVASVQPHAEDGLEHAWMFFLAPDGGGDVTFALVADAACAAGGICTAGGRTLAEVPAASTIPGPGAPGEASLTASFEGMPAEHDGESGFRFRVAFSEDIGISYRSLREDAFEVSGGRVTRGKRVDDRRDLFEMTVRPESDDDVTITLPAGRECSVSGAICTKGDNRRQLANTPAATVAGPGGTAANAPAQGAPTIAGTPRVGETLSASPSGISDADGIEDASFAYQWLRDGADISGATGADYAAVDADEGEPLAVRVSFTDDAGHAESLTSAATGAVAARADGAAPLTGRFQGLPAEHDGRAFTFSIAFSERVGWMNGRRLREDVVAVSGGRATSAGRVDRRRDLWQVTVEPDSSAVVTVTVEAGAACRTPAAVCTSDGRALSETISATVAGPDGTPANAPAAGAPAIAGTARVGETLSASTSGITDADGLANAEFAYQWIRGSADIAGATGATYTAADADAGERLKVRVAFTDDAGHAESVTSAATDAVAARANAPAAGAPAITGEARVGETLTASTSGITDADGLDNATFAYQWLRDGADIPGETGATYTAVEADEGERLKVRVSFEDDAGHDETLTSGSTKRVAARPMPKVSVADARVREAAGATLDFAVTLSAPAPGPVTVGYRTLDASAKAGEDYEARSGTLRFAPGETAKTVAVPVLDDAHDEGTEILVFRLENVRGALLADRFAVGRIENDDHMPAAWLARFGRTVTDQVLDAVGERLAASRAAGARVRLAGQALPLWDDAGERAKAANADADANAGASDRALRGDARDRTLRSDARDRALRGDAQDRVLRGDARDRTLRSDAQDRALRGDARDRALRSDARCRGSRWRRCGSGWRGPGRTPPARGPGQTSGAPGTGTASPRAGCSRGSRPGATS